MKKTVVLIVLTLLLSGCTLDYKLTIDKNMILEEQIKVTEKNSIMSTFTLSPSNYIDDSIADYTDNSDYSNYTLKKTMGSQYSGGIAKAIYMDFNQFKAQNKLKDYFFSDVSMNTNANIVTLNFTANSSNTLLTGNTNESAVVSSANITITVPFKVINNNADKIDKNHNAYTWTYDTMNQNKNISISFDKSKEKIIINISPWVYVLLIIILSIGGFAYYIYYRYKKNSNV